MVRNGECDGSKNYEDWTISMEESKPILLIGKINLQRLFRKEVGVKRPRSGGYLLFYYASKDIV